MALGAVGQRRAARLAGRAHQHQHLLAVGLRHDLIAGVLHVPAFRKVHRDTQVGVQELMAAHHAFGGIVAVGQAVDAAQEVVAVALARAVGKAWRPPAWPSPRATPGSGWVDSQLGTPRALMASSRESVSRKRGTLSGSQPAFDAYSTPRRSDSSSSSRPYLRNQRAETGRGQVAERPHARHEDARQQHAESTPPADARVLLRRHAAP